MISKLKILTTLLLLINIIVGFGQDSLSIRIGPNYSNYDIKAKYFFILDGVPIFKNKQILKLVDTTMVDSIVIHKIIIYNCKNKPLYNAFIEIRTKDSINLGLKSLLEQTNNWIFDNPLADLYLNDKKTNWFKGYKKLSIIHPDLIEKIDLIDATNDSLDCRYGIIKIWIKK